MTLTVHPDPQEPAGGFAFLELPGGSLPVDGVHVSVMESYGERWLAPSEAEGERVEIGDGHWQSDQHRFGPYDVHAHEGADWVRIGPEIVNKIEEYTPLRIVVDGKSHDVSWPDDVTPRAGAAVLGPIQSISRKEADAGGARLVGKAGSEPDDSDTVVPTPPPPPPPQPGPVVEEKGRSWTLPILLLLLIAIAGALVWWFVLREPGEEIATVPDPVVAPVITPEPAPAPVAANPCTLAALKELGGFGAIEAAIRDCAGNVTADDAFELVEEYAANDDPAALLLFGMLYDERAQDPRMKADVGLALEADATKAVEYYARAVKAGSRDAQSRLSATCEQLAVSTSTLAKGAYDDFCG
ncbi:MAG: hypothetical protein AB8B51_16510 [Sedimentitalea sp.]